MVSRLVSLLLAVAIRRWPAHLRETVSLEWAAELHALAGEAGVSGPVRAWRQLRFASSLALARPPGAHPPAGGMRWQASSWGHPALLVSAPLLTMLATLVMLVPLQLIPFGYLTITPTSAALMTAESYVVLACVAMAIGTLLGRRALRWRGGQPAGRAQCAWAALPAIGGLLLVDGLARGAGQLWEKAWLAVVAALCLLLVLPLLARAAAALSGRGHRNLALAGAALIAPVLALATMYVVFLAAGRVSALGSPWRLLARIGQEPMPAVTYAGRGGEVPVETVLTVLPAFVFATILVVLAHAIRLARPLPSAAPAAVAAAAVRPGRAIDTDTPAVARHPWWHRSLLGGAAYSVIAWAVTLTYLTPNIGVQNSWPSRTANPDQLVLPAQPGGWPQWSTEEGRLWMHELQLLSIVCAALCLLCAMAYRGRPVLPTATGATILIATNVIAVREQWTTPRLLAYLAAGGLLLGMAAWWWATQRPGTGQPPGPRARRLVITVTITAALLVPGSFLPRVYALGKQAPPVLLLVAVGLPTILAMLAFMGVRATSARTWPARLTPIGPLLVGVTGVLYYQEGLVPFPASDSPLILVFFFLPLALSVPSAVATAAAIQGARATSRSLRWGVLLLVPMLAAGYVFSFGAIVASFAIARLVLFPMEYGQTYDGLVIVPGSVAIGLGLGFLTAIVVDRPRPSPAPVPSGASTETAGIDELGSMQPGPA